MYKELKLLISTYLDPERYGVLMKCEPHIFTLKNYESIIVSSYDKVKAERKYISDILRTMIKLHMILDFDNKYNFNSVAVNICIQLCDYKNLVITKCDNKLIFKCDNKLVNIHHISPLWKLLIDLIYQVFANQ
jgi:hypothetical protein